MDVSGFPVSCGQCGHVLALAFDAEDAQQLTQAVICGCCLGNGSRRGPSRPRLPNFGIILNPKKASRPRIAEIPSGWKRVSSLDG